MVAMTHRQRRRLLILANAAFAAVIAACAWGALWVPLDAADGQPARPAGRGQARSEHGAAGVGPLSTYSGIYARPLRKPLYDPKPVEIVKLAAPEAKLTAVLAGTMTEPGFTYAIFRVPGGEEKVVPVGQSIEGAEVLEIVHGSVKVRFHGKEMTIQVQKEAAP
jgi:hypothetical protein